LSEPEPTSTPAPTESDPENPEVDVEDSEIDDLPEDNPVTVDEDGLPPAEQLYDPANDGDDSILKEAAKEEVTDA